MFAVIRSGGKQHRVVKGERLNVDLLDVAEGSEIKIEDVLLLANGDAVQVGTPHVAGATVTAKIVKHDKGPKIRVFKRRRRKGFHKTIGHRQHFTQIEIVEIQG
ncbi:MAG: 50S ribosomal protein L21 [Myxococcota bacterium]|nr:50S ribosomal protein L21 [Myxococcota bacterium]